MRSTARPSQFAAAAAISASLLLSPFVAAGALAQTATFPPVPTDLPTETPAPTDTPIPTVPLATEVPTDTPAPANTVVPTDTPPVPVDATNTPLAAATTAIPLPAATTAIALPSSTVSLPPTVSAPTIAPTIGGGGGGGSTSAPAPAGPSGPPPGPVNSTIGAAGGTVSASLPGGQPVNVLVPPSLLAGIQAALPSIANVSVTFDPAPPLPNGAAAGSLGGGDVITVSPPIDIKIVLKDTAGNPVSTGAAGPAGSAGAASQTVDVNLPVLTSSQPAANGVFAWLQGTYSGGTFVGYIRPPADFNPVTGTITVHVSVGSLQGTLFLPAVIVPAWVQNFDESAHLWSGPTADAVDFGPAGPPQTTFTVVAPQVAGRVYVFNPLTANYGWIDVASVGPSGPPQQ
ncbi:MAG: hypothetical protein JO247_15300 [Chloroflexi bacterium]|nr:hypothetical protein [Chloroflexota bacterium]